ncbi:dolichyl-phosphate-mannose--protein mannosyltransferase [Streptomyces sp. NPDC004065]|uniref:dolichyl-phosphate-mannose--protein mannosyltransferase n=1 Tax=Streptomyces sp. NPDC004065 TaxID=3364689 RepID=UPI00384D1AB6
MTKRERSVVRTSGPAAMRGGIHPETGTGTRTGAGTGAGTESAAAIGTGTGPGTGTGTGTAAGAGAPAGRAGAVPAAARRTAAWPERLRRFGYAAPPRTSTPARLVPPFPEPPVRLWRAAGLPPAAARRAAAATGWLGPLLVAALAGVIRLWRLGEPRTLMFDETYYAKDAWSQLRLGYEGVWPDRRIADPQVLAHPHDVPLSDTGAFVAHPPMGKWVIAAGEWVFGLDPVGWRIASAVLGTLSVLMLCRIGRRLLRSTFLGCLAGLLLAVDGLHFVLSRSALLDPFVMFFALAAFGCLLLDRDAARSRLARLLTERQAGSGDPVRPDACTGEGTRLGGRPWRWAAGILLGLASATKWNGWYFLAVFAVLTLLWDAGARRVAGARRSWRAVLRRDLAPSLLSLVPVAVVTYLATWTGWFLSDKGYGRHWADGRGGAWAWIPAPLRSLWHYEHQVYLFNVGLSTPHPYQSNPWSWPVLGRPVPFLFESSPHGRDGCRAAEGCAREVVALGTPLLWWAACGALVYLLYRWAFGRDWRAGAILCAVAAGWLPWFLYQDRTVFSFYAVVFLPYLCLAVAMTAGAFLAGPSGSARPRPGPWPGPWRGVRRRMWRAVGVGALTLLIVWNFVYFYPLYAGVDLPYGSWRARIWLDTWA